MPAQFSGKILNICGELSESKLIAGETFKDIIDGTEISVQHKNQQIFKMAPILTHWFASNHFPRTRDTSSGFTRRWLVFSFNKPVPNARKVADIGELIAGQEREAIVAWAAAGLVRVLTTNGYTIPASHHDVIYEVATMNNTVKFYLEESGKVKLKVSGRVSENKIYMSYWGFCSAAGGVKPAPQHKFRSMMRELQSEYGFRVEMTPTAIGGTECLIDGVQLVG
jgi:phage/plasmid-associated DNA primase